MSEAVGRLLLAPVDEARGDRGRGTGNESPPQAGRLILLGNKKPSETQNRFDIKSFVLGSKNLALEKFQDNELCIVSVNE